jgi:DHA1 family multidrug resistance protein-like MFS transporter
MGVLFASTAATSLAAGVWVLWSLPAVRAVPEQIRTRLVVNRRLTGVLMTGVAGGIATGVYETCWTLLLDLRGADAWQVGLSWTLFAAPFAAFSPIAGRMADHFDRTKLTVCALVASLGFAAVYPFLHSLALLISLGALESIGVAIAYPAAQSLLAESVPASALGRAQGLSNAVQTAAIAIAAGTSGALFGVAPWIPFVAASALAAGLTLMLPFVWRALPPATNPLHGGEPVQIRVVG